ncbi:hypothetical protein AI2999V1_2321 [Enterobacter cloacae]|nr:hypothetical protein AI2999V1_2321 [Enterobacter cloacae]CAH5625292.1 hypothetical protein AI2999V1_2321 [Enterobacter cloacae]
MRRHFVVEFSSATRHASAFIARWRLRLTGPTAHAAASFEGTLIWKSYCEINSVHWVCCWEELHSFSQCRDYSRCCGSGAFVHRRDVQGEPLGDLRGTSFLRANANVPCCATCIRIDRRGAVAVIYSLSDNRRVSKLTLKPGGGYALPGRQVLERRSGKAKPPPDKINGAISPPGTDG